MANGSIWELFGVESHLHGTNSKAVREMLEEEYQDDMTEDECLRCACRVLLETAERGSKGIIITVMRHGQKDMDQLSKEVVMKLCAEIEKEDAEGDAKEDKK